MLTTQILLETNLSEKNNSSEIVGYLIVEGKKHEIKKGDTKIGRDPLVCSIVVDNFTVSKIHSVIESEGKEDTFIYDVGSTNFTKLGKKILKPHYRYKLENGSVITLGNVIGIVDLATEFDGNPTKLFPLETTAFKIGGLVANYNIKINENIFDLETQISQLPREAEIQPCNSTDFFKPASLEKLQCLKTPNVSPLFKQSDKCKKIHPSYIKNKNQTNIKSPTKTIIYDSFEDSNIFNIMTHEQIYSPKLNSQNNSNNDVIITKKNEQVNTIKSLLDDGQDDIFCNFEDLKFLNKEYTSTPLKTQHTPSTSKNKDTFSKPKEGIHKIMQSDLEINKEIDLIKNDVEINRSFNEEFFCDAVDSPKVFKEPVIQENEYHSSIKLTQSLNISDLKNINNTFTEEEKKETFTKIKQSTCNIDEKNMSQLVLNNFNSLKFDPPSQLISSSYSKVTISDENEFKMNNENRHVLRKNLLDTSQYLNKSNKYNSKHETIKNLNKTFPCRPEKCDINYKENIVHDNLKSIKKKSQMSLDTLENKTESHFKIVLENMEYKNFETCISSQLNLKKIAPQEFATCNIHKEITKLDEESNKNYDNQNIKIALEEQFSSDSDEFIASQIIKSQISPNKSINSLEQIQVAHLELKSPTINNFHAQKFQNSFFKETNTDWSLDFIDTVAFSDSISRIDTRKDIFKKDVKNIDKHLSVNEEDQNNVTLLSQTKDLNLFVPESFEDDNTPSDLEIIEESPYLSKKKKIDIKIEKNTEIKEEPNSTKLNQSGQLLNENENSDNSYIFEIDDINENDGTKDNNLSFENQNKEISNENTNLSQHIQSSDSETPDLVKSPKNVVNQKQMDNDGINQNFNLFEDDNSDEINSPNTQVLEETLIKIIEEGNNIEKDKSSLSTKIMQVEIDKTKNFSKDTKNFPSDSLKESPKKRNSEDTEILAKSIKKIKKDVINYNDEVLDNKEKILSFWQVPNIDQVIPKKSTNPKYLFNQKMINNSSNKLDSILCEKFNGDSGFALNKINCAGTEENSKKVGSCGTILKKPIGKKSGPAKNLKRDSFLAEVPLDFTFTTRVLRSVSKHYGTSIVSQNQMVTSCTRNLFKDFPSKTLARDNLRNRTSLKKASTSKIFNDKSYFSCSSVKIVFTGFDSPCLDKIIQELGGSKIDDLKSGQVVVTDRVRRTVKFLCAIGLSLPIVSPNWLLSSKKENRFLNPWQYILKDEESEEKWDFDLRNALEKAKKKKFLQNFYVFATENVQPPPKDILLIAECCGASPLVHRSENWPKKTLILTCEEDKHLWPPKLRSVKILHFEFLLTGVLQQQNDFKTFQLR